MNVSYLDMMLCLSRSSIEGERGTRFSLMGSRENELKNSFYPRSVSPALVNCFNLISLIVVYVKAC